MRLSLRRTAPSAVFGSFLGLLDIKLGSEIILLFGLINKVAGFYGLITVFIGGSFLQLTFYGYSVATLLAYLWALKTVKSEAAKPTLFVSHLYVLDHVILSLAHYLFFQHYWYAVPHDGRRTANSQAQIDLIDLAASRGEILSPSDVGADQAGIDELRVALAGEIWRHEKGFAVGVLFAGWILKIYFILVLYSYAAHLRSSTYHSLPLTSRAPATLIAHPTTEADLVAELENEDLAEGAANGDAGKGNPIIGNKGRSKAGEPGNTEEGDEDDFSWE